MLKQTITYTDYSEVERTETFLFNLSQAEVAEMELSTSGGLTSLIQRIIDEKDQTKLVELFKSIILKAYGEKSPDGKFFRKLDDDGKPLSRNFAQTEAYSDLFMKLVTDADAASAFMKGIIPEAPKQK